MASQHEDSSESDGETEPTKCFHRRLSTNKDIRYNSFIKEGFLNKQNGSFQRWHKRYFKLKSGVLYYSKDKKSTIFNQIDLIDSSIAERSLKNINHSFQVITPFRNLVLCAATRSEMKGWVSAMRAAASKDVREVTSEMAELSSLSDHHNWCVLPNIRPIFCNVCHESLHRVTRSGVTINGLACEVCKFRTHKKCASKSPSTCKWTTLASMGGNIIEDENGDLMMPHQWMMGNFPVSSKCSVCEKPCSSVLKLQDYWCLWCHCTVHTACKDQTVRCSLGPARVSILPPISITNFDEGGFWRASKSPNTSPLLVFLNSKSGDSQGVKMLRRFKQLLNPAQVFDLMNGGPKIGLRLFQNFESFRVLVCGGDGSVGWVLNEIDRLGLHKQCQVGVLPLGTGNDLSRVLGWGASFDDDTQLPALLEKLEHAQIQMFDRWSIYSYETDQTRNRSLTIDPICAYEDTASNHLSRILHSDSHNVVISSAMVLCSIVQDLVSKVGQSFEETEGCSADKDSFAYKCLTLNQKMEALLKTLAEESTIGQSDHEGTVRSKEQLMCRANSLKKAIRQIVELTEKAVDEQNHQTNQFDKDNERTMSEIISTTTLVASLLSSPDRTLADTLSVRRPSDDRGPFVIVTGEEGLHGSCNGDLASVPSVTDNYETHSTKPAASPVENLMPAKIPSREPTPIIFNYQLCDNLPYVNTSSSPTVATHTLAKSPPGKSTDSLLSPSHPYAPSPSVCSALMPSSPGSSRVFDFCRSSVSPTRVYASSGPVPSCDIPSVNVVDDSILDNEVSQVMHDVNGVEKNHLVVPGSHHYHHHHHHHLNPHHHHHHQYCLSLQQHHYHHDHHHHQTNRHHHHHQFKDPNTLIAQHHLHVYSSSDGEASRSSTPRSPQNCPLNLVDRWSPLFGMPADRMNSPSPYFFEHQTDGKLSHDVSPSKACSNHSGSGRHLSSLSTLYRAPDNPSVAQSGLRHSQKSPEGIQFPLLNVPLLQSLPKQVIGKGRKSSPIHSSLISRALMANADALCAPASPLNDLANINLDDFTEKCVMNNYFGIGLDAKIALDFHNKREEHPKKCRSRTKNMMWYGVLGGKEILQRTHKNLDQKVRLECDGKLIPLPNLQGIVILNIPSYMGGTNFWGGSKEDEYFIAPSFDDKVLEVVAVFGSIQLGISRVINIQRHRIAQCHTVRITIIGDEGLPVQVDGEAWIQNPGVVWIQHKNRAQVLIRDRAFEEALKIWTEKQKLERATPREPPLSESELATLTTFTEASRDLFEKVTRELELSPPAQALNFVDGFFAAKMSTISTDGKVPPRISRGEVMEFASHVRSFCYDVRRSVLQSQSTKEELDDDRLRNVLEFLEDNNDKVHNMGAQFYERQRNKDRLKLLFKLPKSSRKHRDSAMESLKPEVLTIRDWTHVDVAQWLNALDLGEYAEVFVAHDIRGSELLTLGRTDLKELGIVKVGHLKRLLQEIKFIKEHLKSVEGRRVRNISEDSTTASSHLAPAQAPASPPLVSPPHQPAVEGGDVIATSSSQETSHAFGVEQANSSSSSSSA